MATTQRQRAVHAATELLGSAGVRALTHRKVDELAGLPAGSTSNYFRTRAALFQGVLDAMVATESPEVEPLAHVRTADELVDGLVDLMDVLTGPLLTTTSARMALLVEAGHEPELRAGLARGRATMARLLRPAFQALGAPSPDFAVDAVAICFEGLFLHALAQHASVDARPHIDLVVRACLP